MNELDKIDEMRKKRENKKFSFLKFYSSFKGKIITWIILFILLFLVLFIYAFFSVYNESNHFNDFKTKYNNNTNIDSEINQIDNYITLFQKDNFHYEYQLIYNDNQNFLSYKGKKNNTQELGSYIKDNNLVEYFKEEKIYIKENDKFVEVNLDIYEFVDPYFLNLNNIYNLTTKATKEASTKYKDGSNEITYSLSLEKLNESYNFEDDNIIFIKDEVVTFKVTYLNAISKIELDLTNLYKLKDENITNYKLILNYSNYGSVSNLVVSR